MSSASPGRRIPERLGWVAMALFLSLALVSALLVGRAYVPATAGIGDLYFLEAGGSGHDALSYLVDVTYDDLPATRENGFR